MLGEGCAEQAVERCDDPDVLLQQKAAAGAGLEAGHPYRKWDDMWFEHPNPTMNEPHKAMCWLTLDSSLDEDTVAGMYLLGRLTRVDNVFHLTRRLFNAFEHAIGTPCGTRISPTTRP